MTISNAESLCPDPADTERFAESISGRLGPGDVVLLEGPLGAGKTCFVRGLARGLGHRGERVLSPTFQLVREHRGGRLPLYHVDLYRLKGPDEVLPLGLEEVFDGDGVSAVEWPERLGVHAPRGAWRVLITVLDSGVRRVTWSEP